ncbi:restriction endonuclease-like domain protein [Mycoplasmoides gallisepticum NC06_2006.080-5-2P]|nr:restriction endonuclease-like domain protein [Mycoplasmoides gallisepticum NC06_2006.080-5-2P]
MMHSCGFQKKKKYSEEIYALVVSNTQSRNIKEFETIIKMILVGSNIFIDTQTKIGKTTLRESCKKSLKKS